MAGIYIHIPFCKTRCIYCDFYSQTNNERIHSYVDAVCQELRMRKEYLKGEAVKTVYFGGGTPSQLSEADFKQIFDTLEREYGLAACEEITLEANPDDVTQAYADMLATLPFNRISMGLQTFDDDTLKLLNRRHNAEQAIAAVKHCRRAGFRNISIDLIYGLPGETDAQWQRDLQQAVSLGVEHISAYHLTYEAGTPLYQMLQARQVAEVDEESSVRFFTMLTDSLRKAGYEHYEISNFCQPDKYSRHNTSYWQGIPYLGCGASAHSFDKEAREWNVASLEKYIRGIQTGHRDFEREMLDASTRYNEYVMTSLRTAQGISITEMEQKFGTEASRYCLHAASPYLESGKLELNENHMRLSREGIFISDGIISDLMHID